MNNFKFDGSRSHCPKVNILSSLLCILIYTARTFYANDNMYLLQLEYVRVDWYYRENLRQLGDYCFSIYWVSIK